MEQENIEITKHEQLADALLFLDNECNVITQQGRGHPDDALR